MFKNASECAEQTPYSLLFPNMFGRLLSLGFLFHYRPFHSIPLQTFHVIGSGIYGISMHLKKKILIIAIACVYVLIDYFECECQGQLSQSD